jgi:hypothetical protein
MKSQLKGHLFLYIPVIQRQLKTIRHAIPKSVSAVVSTATRSDVVRVTLEKFGLHVGNMKFNTKNRQVYIYNYVYNFTCAFSYTLRAIKYTDNNRKNL